jgi:aspartokinase
MKLTIDTQVDTHDDIRKVLQILTSILEKKDAPVSSAAADTTNLMSMFSDNTQTGTLETNGNAPDFSSFLNLTEKKDKKEDKPRIELY